MLDLLNEMLKFDNRNNFYADEGADDVFKPNGASADIEDSTAKNYINDLATDSAEEFQRARKTSRSSSWKTTPTSVCS